MVQPPLPEQPDQEEASPDTQLAVLSLCCRLIFRIQNQDVRIPTGISNGDRFIIPDFPFNYIVRAVYGNLRGAI